ncbi:MAG: thioredoxin TrxC [Woeseia sp.]
MSTILQIVCPHCDTVNRVPSSRLADEPNCGKCSEGLFDAKPQDLSGERFRKHVSRNDIPVVVDFWAPWCGPCKAMAPEFEQASLQLKSAARLVKLNTEGEPAVAAQFSIRSIPTMVLFRNGHEVARRSGTMRSGDIVRWVHTQSGVGLTD